MNSYERYTSVLQGRPVDFLPRTPILMQYAAEHIGEDYAGFASDYRVLVKANLACAAEFGMDQVSCISDPYRETQGFGGSIEYTKTGPPISTHPLKENRDFDTLLKPDPMASERMLDRVNAARSFKKKCGGDYSILGWIEGPAAEAADLRDVSEFLLDLAMDELYACDLMDICLETGIKFARVQVEAGADTAADAPQRGWRAAFSGRASSALSAAIDCSKYIREPLSCLLEPGIAYPGDC